MKVTINFVISDTFAKHIPECEAMGGREPNQGTQLTYVCEGIKSAVELANKLVQLTTGYKQVAFNYKHVRSYANAGCTRLAWSYRNRTHHCELLFNTQQPT